MINKSNIFGFKGNSGLEGDSNTTSKNKIKSRGR